MTVKDEVIFICVYSDKPKMRFGFRFSIPYDLWLKLQKQLIKHSKSIDVLILDFIKQFCEKS